jgi:hypothetical protein
MKLLKATLIATAIFATLSTSAIAIELDGLMTVDPKVMERVPLLDEYGNPTIDQITSEPKLSSSPVFTGGSYFSLGANNPNTGVSQEGGSAGGITLGAHQPFTLNPDVPNPPSGTGYGSTPVEESTAMKKFSFFGASTYIGTNPVSFQSGNVKATPSVTVDVTGNISADLSSWEVMWNGSVFEQGPRPSGSAFIPATGTYDYDTGDYVIDWVSKIVGGPFNGVPGYWHLEGTILADPAVANVLAEPQTLNVQSQGDGFIISILLTDPDGNVIPAFSINEGVMISSIGGVDIPDGEITENVAGRLIDGDILIAAFDDPATGNRQDVIAAVSDAPDGSSVEVCASGKARDTDGILRPFEGCSDITIRNKGNR